MQASVLGEHCNNQQMSKCFLQSSKWMKNKTMWFPQGITWPSIFFLNMISLFVFPQSESIRDCCKAPGLREKCCYISLTRGGPSPGFLGLPRVAQKTVGRFLSCASRTVSSLAEQWQTSAISRPRLLLWVALVNLQHRVWPETLIGITQAITLLTALRLPSSTLDCVPWEWSASSIGTQASGS